MFISQVNQDVQVFSTTSKPRLPINNEDERLEVQIGMQLIIVLRTDLLRKQLVHSLGQSLQGSGNPSHVNVLRRMRTYRFKADVRNGSFGEGKNCTALRMRCLLW
jgi:hypothetical protein